MFGSAPSVDMAAVSSGERVGDVNLIFCSVTFEKGLIAGRFAKLDTGSIDNLDNSATPVIAGVVLRDIANPIEDLSTFNTDNAVKIEYMRQGLCTVEVVTGDTPAFGGTVYAHNDVASATDYGKATTTSTNNVAVDAEFIEEIATNVWLIRLK